MPKKFDPTTELINRTLHSLSKAANRRVAVDAYQATRVLNALLKAKGINVYVDGIKARPCDLDEHQRVVR